MNCKRTGNIKFSLFYGRHWEDCNQMTASSWNKLKFLLCDLKSFFVDNIEMGIWKIQFIFLSFWKELVDSSGKENWILGFSFNLSSLRRLCFYCMLKFDLNEKEKSERKRKKWGEWVWEWKRKILKDREGRCKSCFLVVFKVFFTIYKKIHVKIQIFNLSRTFHCVLRLPAAY